MDQLKNLPTNVKLLAGLGIVVIVLLLVYSCSGSKADPSKFTSITECTQAGYNEADCINYVQQNTARMVSQNPNSVRKFTSMQECEMVYGVGQCGSPVPTQAPTPAPMGPPSGFGGPPVVYVQPQPDYFTPMVAGMMLGMAMNNYAGVPQYYNHMPASQRIYNRTTIIHVQGTMPPAQAAPATQSMQRKFAPAPQAKSQTTFRPAPAGTANKPGGFAPAPSVNKPATTSPGGGFTPPPSANKPVTNAPGGGGMFSPRPQATAPSAGSTHTFSAPSAPRSFSPAPSRSFGKH